jgi:hypothetical protein
MPSCLISFSVDVPLLPGVPVTSFALLTIAILFVMPEFKGKCFLTVWAVRTALHSLWRPTLCHSDIPVATCAVAQTTCSCSGSGSPYFCYTAMAYIPNRVLCDAIAFRTRFFRLRVSMSVNRSQGQRAELGSFITFQIS